MLKPVSILALDEPSALLAAAVQRRVAAACGLEDLVQHRVVGEEPLAQLLQSIHAQRQRPGSPLRMRDDISTREQILLVLAAAGPARGSVLETAAQVHRLYDIRRLAEFFTVELLLLLPDVFAGATPDAYGATYSLLKLLSAADPKPFHEVWLLDSTNGNRVRFAPIEESGDSYAEAIAGALTFEPELSGALAGAFRPRGMDATFSSFGFAELFFPRDAALRRLEPRLAAELIGAVLLRTAAADGPSPALRAKQLGAGDEFAVPLSRIGVDAGHSLFQRFQPKSAVSEKTRSAEELIAAVRNELKVHRDGVHLRNLETLAKQGEQTAAAHAALLARVADETLDREDYASAIRLYESLLDPLPDLRSDSGVAPRNLVTEINTAAASLDQRLRFFPNSAASDAARRRVRELDSLLTDQQLVAATLAPVSAADQLAELEREKEELTRRLPELVFAEEGENNAARNAAIDAETVRLSEETQGREGQLRELFDQRPRAEQALREMLEERRAFLWRQILWAAAAVAALYGVAFVLDLLLPHLRRITTTAILGVGLFAIVSAIRYVTDIAPRLRAARENLQRIADLIVTTDKAKNAAHNDELQFEHEVAHRKTTLNVLRRTREFARSTLDGLRGRLEELSELAGSFVPSSILAGSLSIAVVDEADVDAWYDRTAEDRKPLFREFPVKRSESRHSPVEVLRERITAYAAGAFDSFRNLTLAQAAALAPEAALGQHLKRFTQYSAPLIEIRTDDLQAQQAMQRDTTLWIDSRDAGWVAQMQRRLPDASLRPSPDPLRISAVTRVLHYPAYVLGQIEYYRAQYEGGEYPESADLPDLLPVVPVAGGPEM